MNPPEPSKPRSSPLSIVLAAAAGLGAIGGLLFLSGGLFLFVVIFGGLIFAAAAVHYVIWGWWLGGILRSEDEADTDDGESDGRGL